MIKTLCVLSLLLTPMGLSAADELFAGGQSAYTIVLPADASPTERIAARELQQYIREISGVTLPLTDVGASARVGAGPVPARPVPVPARPGSRIVVGWTAESGIERPDSTDDAFTYRTVGGDLHIVGGSGHGTMYGVFTFLERELGVHWFTSSCTHVPRLDRYVLPSLDHSERPALRHRLDFCYDALRHREWAAHNRMNDMHVQLTTRHGSFSAIWGSHTFGRLVPPYRYFAGHPEYFSLVDGQRSDKGQLCLSNADMRRTLTANLLTAIAANPGFWCYDVSQNDNLLDCECEACQTLTSRYGGRSGALLWFVNQVAADVARQYPGVYVSTFAYQTTRQAPPPGVITPADNVVVRLCDVECCMAHPLADCEMNRSFRDDLSAWLRLTPNVYIWDYACSFYHYLLPFPDYHALAANFRLFAEAGAIGVMEEGAHDAPWSEFSELKQWMIARLLWNPCQDVDSLATLFIDGYYGAAAPYVRRYYALCQSRTEGHHFTLKVEPTDAIYGDDFIPLARRLAEQALAAATQSGDPSTLQRTKRVAAQVYYLQLQRAKERAVREGTVEKLRDILRTDSTIVRESGYTLQSVLDKLGIR